MHPKRQYMLDVVRGQDGKVPACGVRYAHLQLSYLKVLEIAAASKLKGAQPGVSPRMAQSAPPVLTEGVVQWLDSQMRPVPTRFAFRTEHGLGSLVAIDRSGGFHLWTLGDGAERLVTPTVPVALIQAEFVHPANLDEHVAPGIRRVLQQPALPALA